MVSNISTSLNQFLAANFSDIGGQSVSPFRLPTLTPNAVQSAPESDTSQLDDRRQSEQQQALVEQRSQQRQQNLKDFAKPQVRLLPSDEVQLFARAALETTTALSSVIVQQSSLVSEETNRARRAVLSSENRETLNETLQARAQQSVAHLYARNANAVYNVQPLLFEAA